MSSISGLDYKIQEMALRIRELREITRFTPAEMAEKTGVSVEEYLACENGEKDLNFAFIYRCALAFGVDVTDIIEGVSPTLRSYTMTRAGKGQRIDQAHGMEYYNLASSFLNRIAETLPEGDLHSQKRGGRIPKWHRAKIRAACRIMMTGIPTMKDTCLVL